MRINNNIQALNAYRQLSQNQVTVSKHLERLSSGLRINRAADDAAGLAISEKMRSQIRGLNMAERNTLDAISLIQTAEGALGTTHAILQRMRELSVQAANGTLNDSDRAAIQNEIDQLTFEIDRIAETTQFNAKKILRGSELGRAFANINATEVSYVGAGKWEGVVHAAPTSPAAIEVNLGVDLGSKAKADVLGKTFTINGKTYELYDSATTPTLTNGNIGVDVNAWTAVAPATDADKAANANLLANQLKAAIEANETGNMTATVTPADPGAEDGIFVSNALLTIQTSTNKTPKEADLIGISTTLTAADGVNLYEPTTTNTRTTFYGNPDSLNAKSVSMDFAEVPKVGDYIIIDGVRINFANANANYDPVSKTASINVQDETVFGMLNKISTILTDVSTNHNADIAALSSHTVIGNTLVLATNKTDDGLTNGLEIELFDGDFEANAGQDLKLGMQIGANASENMEVTVSAMDAAKLGIARTTNRSIAITTPGLNAQAGVDISTQPAAQAAIAAIDQAISLVSVERSKLGAFQNRMEHTISNLGIAAENLTAAESRVRDADMAKEMTDFTKNNIINQAATAMLAQANQLPQGVLQLLK